MSSAADHRACGSTPDSPSTPPSGPTSVFYAGSAPSPLPASGASSTPPSFSPQYAATSPEHSPEMRDGVKPPARGSNFATRMHSRTNTMVLTETIRRNSTTNTFDFTSMDSLDLGNDTNRHPVFPIPNFSTVSLVIVWVISVLGSLLCYVLSEVYQAAFFTKEFPLPYVSSLACHLSILASLVVFVLGRQRHGARVYRFYQPFAGGQRFVVTQFLGVFSLAVAFVCTVVYRQLLLTPADICPGVYLAIAAVSTVGNIFVCLSPRYFEANQAVTAPTTTSTGGGSSPRSDIPHSSDGRPVMTFKSLLAMLRRSPNTESALVGTLCAGQLGVFWAAHHISGLVSIAASIVLLIQLLNGLLIHYFIGCRRRPGYRFFQVSLPRRFDTAVYWTCWVLFALSVFAGYVSVRIGSGGLASSIAVPLTFYYGVFGLNIYSSLALLLTVRSTPFRRTVMSTPTTVFEYGGYFAVAAGLLAATFCTGVVISTGLASAAAIGSDAEGLLRVGFYLCQGFSLLLPPMIQAAGRAMHGEGFTIFTHYRGYPSFLVAQLYGWVCYITALFCTALFVLTRSDIAGAMAASAAALSTLSICYSFKEFSWIRWYLAFSAREKQEQRDAGVSPSVLGFSMDTQPFVPSDSAEKAAAHRPAASPTLAEVVSAAAATSSATAANGTSPAGGRQSIDDAEDPAGSGNAMSVTSLTFVMNGEMILAYMLGFCNVIFCALIDVSTRKSIAAVEVPVDNMYTAASCLFLASVPLAHLSGRDKGVHVLSPFSGSGPFVALQVLGWFIYAVFLIGDVISCILGFYGMPTSVVANWLPGGGVMCFACTMVGLLQLIPLVLITISVACESALVAARQRRHALAVESFEKIRGILRDYVAVDNDETPEGRAVLQLAFATLVEPALRQYEIPYSRRALQLARPDSDNDDDDDDDGQDVSGGERDSSGDDLVTDHRARRLKYEGARVIVILMCCASATLYVVAAFFSHVGAFALACSVCALLMCTADCIAVYVGYGMLLWARTGTYRVFMPFKGGAPFVYRQIGGWSCFAGSFIITLIAGLEEDGVSAGAMIFAGALSVASQIFILESVPVFNPAPPQPGQRSFLEQNGEGVVAVMAFTGAVSFAHVYDRLHSFFYDDGGSGDGAIRGWTLFGPNAFTGARRTKVPFVLALLSIVIAVPLVLMAMARTTRQWEKIARQARRQRANLGNDDDDTSVSTPRSSTMRRPRRHNRHSNNNPRDHPSDDDDDDGDGARGLRHDEGQQRSGRGILAVGLTNLLEVATITLSAVAPFSLLFLIYYFTQNFSPRVLEVMTSYMPVVFLTAILTLALSIVPYLADVGVPKIAVVVRVYIVTYCLYGMPILLGAALLGPYLLHPSVGTRYLLFVTLVVTILGSYKQARRGIKFGVYSLFGYCSYQLFLEARPLVAKAFHSGGFASLFTRSAARLVGSYIVDTVFLFFWIWYLPTYHGQPELSGVWRSMAFTRFARRYLWEDVVRFFSLRIIQDDTSVHMRDPANKYLFSFHPHGVFPGTALYCSVTKEWQRKIGLNDQCYLSTHEASIVFNVPGIRDFNLYQGALSVSRRGLEGSLSRGNSVLIVTGGQAEMLHTRISDKVMTLVTQHKGFIRIAIRNRAPLVPLLSFGEQNVMGLLQWPRVQKVMLKIFGFPFPMVPFGAFGLPFPRRTHLALVVGKALAIPEGADPENQEHINALSDAYFAEIKRLFYTHRVEAGYPELELVLVNDNAEKAKRRAEREAKNAAGKKTEVK